MEGYGPEVAFVYEEMTYHQAMENCRNLGGILLEPDSLKSQNAVTLWISNNLNWTSYWIGVNDFRTEGL